MEGMRWDGLGWMDGWVFGTDVSGGFFLSVSCLQLTEPSQNDNVHISEFGDMGCLDIKNGGVGLMEGCVFA